MSATVFLLRGEGEGGGGAGSGCLTNKMLSRRALQLDLDAPDVREWPGFSCLPFKQCILEPGQMLFIPPKHWHYVKALDTSFSVSFWWS